MPTTRDVITRALRKSGIVKAGQAADGEDFALALDALNDMLHAWKLDGVDVSHTTLAPTDTFPLDDEYIEGTVYVLAGRVSPDFSAPPSFNPDDWFRKIQANYMAIAAATMDAGLKNMPSQRFRRYF